MSAFELDLAVVGAGIHGVGVLQAAAAAGWRVRGLEARAIAAGTSSRSSKLIHGGLRYLESGQLRLVRESLRERAILLRVAPELVRLEPFMIPLYAETSRGPWTISAGLSLYALLAGLGPGARFGRVPRAEWDALDGLETRGLRHVFRYFDGQTDDAALSRAVAASAIELGAEFECPAEVEGIERVDGGWHLRYRTPEGERELRARCLVNAAGPWATRVLDRVHPAPPERARRSVELVVGTHVEYPGELLRGHYYTEAEDRRAVFVMPWKGHTLVGTTERPYDGDPARIEPSDAELEYLRRTFRRHFPRRETRVLDAWAGARVLPAGEGRAFGRPREVELATDAAREPSLLSIFGGKLTGYRATAEKVVARLAPRLARAGVRVERRADTATLPLRPVERVERAG